MCKCIVACTMQCNYTIYLGTCQNFTYYAMLHCLLCSLILRSKFPNIYSQFLYSVVCLQICTFMSKSIWSTDYKSKIVFDREQSASWLFYYVTDSSIRVC